jgi:hypothetical protein
MFQYRSCLCIGHEPHEYLSSYTNTSSFKAWFSASGSILWCQTISKPGEERSSAAACISRELLENSAASHVEIFYHRCGTISFESTTSPTSAREISKKRSIDTEVIVRSFICQALMKGFKFPAQNVEGTEKLSLLVWLMKVFDSIIRTRNCRMLLLVDNIDEIRASKITSFVAYLRQLLIGELSQRCSVMLGGSITPDLIEVLQGCISVHKDTEYEGRPWFYPNQDTPVPLTCV